jgi:hypothetical protein
MLDLATKFDSNIYARCIEASKKVRWEIERDVIRGRSLDFDQPFLPDGLSGVATLRFLDDDERRFMSQIQGRTYAAMFGLVERYINAQVIELQSAHALGDQTALEAMVRFSDEELKHQALFRRIESLADEGMPRGYRFSADADEVAAIVLSKSTWSVLGLTLVIELFTQAHYRQSVEPNVEICPLFKDVFLHHWKEEAQHAVLDELEWKRVDATLDAAARDSAVNDLISLVVAVDAILQSQAEADANYFFAVSGQSYYEENEASIRGTFLDAYRWQYILSGTSLPRFQKVIGSLIDSEQGERIASALETLAPQLLQRWADGHQMAS